MRNRKQSTAEPNKRAGRVSEAGFTLVEVMSAFVILAIAVTAAYATFTFQHASFTTQNEVVEAQQNLRAAMDMLSRDVRLAGYGVPAAVRLPAGMLASGDNTIRNVVPLNRSTAPDDLYVLYAYDMDSSLPQAKLAAALGAPGATIYVDNVTGFSVNDYIIVSNGSEADLFQITGTPDAGTGALPHNGSGVNDSTNHLASLSYVAGDSVAKARFVRYFVDTVTDPSHPTLMLDKMTGAAPQPLADDIENMQLQYGLDTDGDGVVNTIVDLPANPTQISQIRQVRLYLSARTRLPERGWHGARPPMADWTVAGPADGYRRRTVDNVAIDFRNP